MNLRDAKRLQPGAIVRRAWNPDGKAQGIMLAKVHVKEEHVALLLGGKKKERWDVTVHWLQDPPGVWDTKSLYFRKDVHVQTHQNWEIMVVQHV